MPETPQERTEQDALELARTYIKHYEPYPAIRDKEGPYILASALLSLAAQSEELRAELEKERAEHLDHEDRAQRETKAEAIEQRRRWERKNYGEYAPVYNR